jgi:hypothetical protein
MPVCKQFLANKKELVDEFISERKINSVFHKYCRDFETNVYNGLRIEQQLDIVHQRVMRYGILLKEYSERLPLDSQEKRTATGRLD